MKASAAVAAFLNRHQVQYCFELAGGMITHLLDSLAEDGRFTIISMHHEQAAAFAAEGIARYAAGRSTAVAMGTSGPGATNLLTGVGSCWFDSVPCLFITGQVNVGELKGDLAVRQQGFQELDIVSMARPITKRAVQITAVNQLLPELHLALSLASSGRMGPVLIDIPNDVQRLDIDDALVDEWLAKPLCGEPPTVASSSLIDSTRTLCRESSRPLVCFGGGARWATSLETWIDSLESRNIPYVSTLMGHERVRGGAHYLGMIGSYGRREANWAVQNCDVLLVIGARLDVRQTGSDITDFARHAKIVHVDIDRAQLDNRVKAHVSVCCDSESFFRQFAPAADLFLRATGEWSREALTRQAQYNADEYPEWALSPHRIFALLNRAFKGQAVDYVCDVGNHQMWAAQGLRLGPNQSAHYSGGMGAMGFALPAAIGIALASGLKTVVITGDGSLQINSHELDTLNRLQLNVTIVVMNNFALGMVKNFQDMYFNGRDQSTRHGYSCPSFSKLGEAYGLESVCVDTMQALEDAFSAMVLRTTPLLIEIKMEGATECRPRLTFGAKLDQQYPKL